jgi:hypothetical protein
MDDKIRQLIKDDKVELAIEELLARVSGKDEDLNNDLNNYLAELSKNKKDSRRGLITNEEENKTRTRVRFAIQEILQETQKTIVEVPPLVAAEVRLPAGAPSVFISYNHSDVAVADNLKAALEEAGIAVRIDKAVMDAGANIQEFIESSIRDTDVTLSIISNRSLVSAWVALESIGAFYQEKFTRKKHFIACYVDDDFFQPDFRLNATRHIDTKIEEIDNLIPAYKPRRLIRMI